MVDMALVKHPLVISAIIIISFLILGIFVSIGVRYILLKALKGKENLFYNVYRALRLSVVLWFVVLGIYISMRLFGEYLGHSFNVFLQKAFILLLISSISYTAGNLLSLFIEYQIQVKSTIIDITAKWGIFLLGLLFGLNSIGVQIAPLLTALGIGGLAVALALQPLLSNLFSGIYITSSKRVEVGDVISVGGYTGEVVDIGVYSTVIRDYNNNLIYIPNTQIINSIFLNFNKPTPAYIGDIKIGVSYESDPRRVRDILYGILKDMENFEGFDKTFEPKVWFDDFADFALIFTVRFGAKDRLSWRECATEIRNKIYERFKEEGIEIPFPIRTVYLRK
ncbi:MAG: mechanosensitive ion channel family protein [candidate division WOR-3 bacterium]